VPPRPNSPPDNVFRRIGRREAGLGSKKRGDAPPPFHGISKITLKVAAVRRRGKSPKERSRSVPRPARGDPLSPRERLERSTDGRRVPGRDPRARPSSQSFSRGCSPWRPRCGYEYGQGVNGTRSSGFSRVAGGAPDTTRRAVLFRPAGPYLRPSRFRGGRGDRLTHVQVPFTWNLSPSSAFKVLI
ncbi:unnamed protein product, partial [Prunus brigantina]